jgi:hypothetical protein
VDITAHTRETTSLTDIDRAFGKWLRQPFENTVITDTAREENIQAIKFFARPAKEKVFQFDDFGTPIGFVRRFERAAKAQGVVSKTLPAVYYSSGGVVDAASLADHVPEHLDTFESDGAGWDIELFSDKVALSYRVVVCAWDHPTLTALTMALRSFLRQSLLLKQASRGFMDSPAYTKYGTSMSFKAKTMLMGLPITLDADIDSLGSEMLSRSISTSEEKRLITNTITINIIADTVTGFSYPNTIMDFEGSREEIIK